MGSNISTFTARYGQPDTHTDVSTGQYYYQKYGSGIDFLIVATDTADGGTYTQRAYYLTIQADRNGWSITQANGMCGTFYPYDAVYQNQVVVANGPAIDRIYYSASLAELFPASAFTDGEQNTVKAGMFDVQVLYRDSSETSVDSCSIIIGEQQTS